ncbi:MAG: hypothetical protein M0Q53_14820 [Prolixibacteraceae bacterium]|jgi:hypothetical protein|nr:hypothetical protein [Prolixibacteraceae bacterium]
MKKIAILFILFGVFACSDSRTKHIKTFLKEKKGELIYLPDSFTVQSLDVDSTYSLSNSKKFVHCLMLRVVTSINGDCHVCVSQLKEWESVVNKWPKEKIRFLFFIHAENYARFELMNKGEISFKYPVVYDYKNDFVLKNKIPDDYLLNTMLIDSTGKVIVVGNPLKSKEILTLYENAIFRQNQ